MRILTLTTDFGLEDYYVGAVKGTVLRLLGPEAHAPLLVDLAHTLPPGDVAAAAHLLAGAAPTFPAGTVHLAVVDPGVGSTRRILAVAATGQLFLAPDNGLLTPWLETGAAEVRSVTRQELFLTGPGSTFHGRDRFAPVAAFLLRGDPRSRLEQLGPTIDDPVRLTSPPPQQRGDALEGRVIHVDRFGNLITDLPAAWLPEGALAVTVAGHRVIRRVVCYAELAPDEAGMLVGSRGTLELSLNGASLATRWGIGRGTAVRVEAESR
jgi:S-adenosylmethionine hydrolase